MSHLICCLLDVKFACPVPLEINGINQDKSGQWVQHVWLDQIFDLGLSDLLNPVVDQPSRGFSIAVVSLLKDISVVKGFVRMMNGDRKSIKVYNLKT